jgi:hypothetical protein
MAAGFLLTSGFGPRDGGMHWGQDIGWPGGSGGLPVYAMAGGTVTQAGPADGFGMWVCIDHPEADGGGYSVYGHVVPLVSVGARVEAGEQIAYINPDSNTNGRVAPHLHIEVHELSWVPPGIGRLDPMVWLAQASYPGEVVQHNMIRGLDFAAARPGAAAVRDAGYRFVVRYLSSGGRNLPGKQLLPEEAEDYRAHCVEIVSNFESYADRMKEGHPAGVEDARAALDHVLRCGGRADRPIYFSADWDATEWEQAAIDDYLRGAAEIIGAEWVGIYGGYWPVKRALDNGTARWAWQAQAWSGGNVDPRIHLLQRNNDGYASVGGVECDINEAHAADYGQWSITGEDSLMGTDDVLGDIREQLCGHGQREPGQYGGWPQLGNRTLVDALAMIGQSLDIPGFRPTDSK